MEEPSAKRRCNNSPLVTLCAQGERIVVSRDTLLSSGDNMLAKMVSGQFKEGIVMEDGSIFVDEDPCIMKNVLIFLRTQELPMPPLYGVSTTLLKTRLLYWGLASMEKIEKGNEGITTSALNDQFLHSLELTSSLQPLSAYSIFCAVNFAVRAMHNQIKEKIEKCRGNIESHLKDQFRSVFYKTTNTILPVFRFNILPHSHISFNKGVRIRSFYLPEGVGADLAQVELDNLQDFLEELVYQALKSTKIKGKMKVKTSITHTFEMNVMFCFNFLSAKGIIAMHKKGYDPSRMMGVEHWRDC